MVPRRWLGCWRWALPGVVAVRVAAAGDRQVRGGRARHPANAAEFGYTGSGANRSAYPKARVVALAECGGVWPWLPRRAAPPASPATITYPPGVLQVGRQALIQLGSMLLGQRNLIVLAVVAEPHRRHRR